MPRNLFDPLDPNERYQDAAPPEGGYNVTNPHLNRPRDPRAAAFIASRNKNPMTDPAQAARTVDVSDRYDESRGGGPLQGADRVRYTGSGSLNPEQYTDVIQSALVDNANNKQPITATMNGVNYTYTPRVKVNDQKAQMYLQDAANRRAETTTQEAIRAAKLEAERGRANEKYDKDIKLQGDYFAADNARRDKDRAETKQDRRDAMADEQTRLRNKVMAAGAETAAFDATPEGRMAKRRAGVGEKLIESTDPTTRRAGAGLVGEAIGVDNFENAVRGSYESRIGELRPLIKQVQQSMSSQGHGFYRSPADVQHTEFLMQQVRKRAQSAGFTPEEIALIETEMLSGERGGGVGDFFSNLFSLNV